jgi:hypothetical protein
MFSVDTRSHVNKQLVNINTFRIYTNSIQAIRKTLWEKDIGKRFINVPAVFIKFKKPYILQKSTGMILISIISRRRL